MRLLLINYEYPPIGAGAATATRAIARALHASGNSVTVLTAGFRDLVGRSDEEGVNVIRLRSRRRRCESATILEMTSFVVHALGSVRRVVRSERPEGVIAFFSIPSGPVALWARAGTDMRYVVSLRGGDVPGAEKGIGIIHRCLAPLRRRILRKALAVVANSPGLKLLSEKADPVPVRMIPNGVDVGFFVPSNAPVRPPGPFRILFVGRFQAQKNLLWLVDEFARLRDSLAQPIALHLVGDGPQRPAVAARANALNLGKTVSFTGWQNPAELRGLYQAADLLVNPSHYEGMPNVVLEAMACGCPVLASRVPGNRDVVVDGVTGWLFDLGEPAGFGERVREAVARAESSHAMRSEARKRAERDFSWNTCAKSYLELFGSPPSLSPSP